MLLSSTGQQPLAALFTGCVFYPYQSPGCQKSPPHPPPTMRVQRYRLTDIAPLACSRLHAISGIGWPPAPPPRLVSPRCARAADARARGLSSRLRRPASDDKRKLCTTLILLKINLYHPSNMRMHVPGGAALPARCRSPGLMLLGALPSTSLSLSLSPWVDEQPETRWLTAMIEKPTCTTI